MIEQINLHNFKCFEELHLPLKKLTLLSGANASGKSSVIQSLVLLHQTMQEHEWSAHLVLNGRTIHAGTAKDVIDKISGRNSLGIDLIERNIFKWRFSGDRDDMSLSMSEFYVNGNDYEIDENNHFLIPSMVFENVDLRPLAASMAKKITTLSYISAERIGPKEYYRIDDSKSIAVVGAYGENAVSILYLKGEDEILSEVAVAGVPPTLFHQVQARMQEFFPGCEISVKKISEIDAVILGVRSSSDTDFHRPIHVGFGITQVLPIVVAALSAKKGNLLLIENPEVHLHPAGQALMGNFLCSVANAGVQIIVESHSDHLLNGIRRAVKSQSISNDDVALHYFQKRNTSEPQVISPIISIDGSIDTWPIGFFDQYEIDINYFAGWGA
ncbi:AAA family ATPase [Aeromonas veronii]|uniref:AAA family ATPase n=1 Tax=Aeromonas veronii TaxID=654 RepID=UPI0009C06980|nr:DUF3696 domain-containing protein [Aeromonas veronii]